MQQLIIQHKVVLALNSTLTLVKKSRFSQELLIIS